MIPLAVCIGGTAGNLGWGIQAQLEDRRAGGDREAASARAPRPARPAAPPPRRARHAGRACLAEGVPIGRTNRGELAMVGRGSARSGCHVLIAGASGAGKTSTLGAMGVDYVTRSGFGAVSWRRRTKRHAGGGRGRRRGARHAISPLLPERAERL